MKRTQSLSGTIIGVSTGIIFVIITIYLDIDSLFLSFVLLSLIGGYYLSILIHELGHLFGGMIVGLKPVGILVSSIMLTFEKNGRPSFSFRKGFGGGLALCISKDKPISKLQSFCYISGGPIASLLFGLLGVWIGFSTEETLSLVSKTIGYVSIFMGFYSLKPMVTKGLRTDGSRLIDILKGGQQFHEMNAHFTLFGQLMISRSPKESSDDLIRILLDAERLSPEWRAGHFFAYTKALYHKDLKQAESHLLAMCTDIESLVPILRDPYIKEKIIFRASYYGDLTEADTLRELSEGIISERHVAPICEAVLEMKAENFEGARTQLDLATNFVSTSNYRQLIPLYLQTISHLKEQLTLHTTNPKE